MKKSMFLSAILLLLALSSCKKEKKVAPEKETPIASFDIKQYFIVGEYTTTYNGKPFKHPLLITFEENAQTIIYDFSAVGKSTATYKFENNQVIINYGGATNWVFDIKDAAVIKMAGFTSSYANIKLYKIPATNQLVGSFSGVLSNRETNGSMYFRYIFNDAQFGESSVEVPQFTYALSSIKNVAAVTYVDGIRRYFLVLEGKLMLSRYNINDGYPARFFYGTLSSD